MAKGATYADVTAGRSHGEEEQEAWGATASLRSHTSSRRSEETPLLGDDAQNVDRRTSTWEGEADLEGLKWWKRPSHVWLLPPFFLFALAIGGIIVPKLNLILQLVCRDYFVEKSSKNPNFVFAPVVLGESNPQCRDPVVQSLVTKFTLALTVTTGIISAIAAPLIGAMSDRYGRCKMLVWASLGAFSGELITIIIATNPDKLNYHWFLLGAVLDGISGSFTTSMALSYAYASDCTAPPKRAIAFGRFHACLFGGIALGPLLTAILFRLTHNLVTVFWIALGIHVFFMFTLAFIIPESLSKKRQLLAREKHTSMREIIANRSPTWLNKARQANIFEPIGILWPTGPGSSSKLRYNLSLLAAVDTILFGVAMGAMTVVVYYTGFEFGWETDDTSFFMSIVNIVRVSGLLILLPLLNYIFRGIPARRARRTSGIEVVQPNSGCDQLDLWTIRFAILAELLGYLGYCFSRTGGFFVLSGVVTSIGGIGSPTLQSALTKHIPQDRIGAILGATGLLHALARVVCPLVFNLIYAQTVGRYAQAVFVVLAGCFGVALIASFGISPHVYLDELPSQPEQTGTEYGSGVERNADALLNQGLAVNDFAPTAAS